MQVKKQQLEPDMEQWTGSKLGKSTSRLCIVTLFAAKLLQSCPTLCNPIDGSPPGSHIPGTLQARTLEWIAISFSNAWKWKVKVKSLSPVGLFEIPWTVAYQAPPSMGFSRQESWSGLPLPSLSKPYKWLFYHWWFTNSILSLSCRIVCSSL